MLSGVGSDNFLVDDGVVDSIVGRVSMDFDWSGESHVLEWAETELRDTSLTGIVSGFATE